MVDGSVLAVFPTVMPVSSDTAMTDSHYYVGCTAKLEEQKGAVAIIFYKTPQSQEPI